MYLGISRSFWVKQVIICSPPINVTSFATFLCLANSFNYYFFKIYFFLSVLLLLELQISLMLMTLACRQKKFSYWDWVSNHQHLDSRVEMSLRASQLSRNNACIVTSQGIKLLSQFLIATSHLDPHRFQQEDGYVLLNPGITKNNIRVSLVKLHLRNRSARCN